jgi:hypothetical protein
LIFFRYDLLIDVIFGALDGKEGGLLYAVFVVYYDTPSQQLFQMLLHMLFQLELVKTVNEVGVHVTEDTIHFTYVFDFTILVKKILLEKTK